MDLKKIVSILAIIILLPNCHAKNIKQNLIIDTKHYKQKNEDHPLTITVWVHGTHLFPHPFLPTFFYALQGLHLATELDEEYRHRTIAKTLAKIDPIRFPLEHFYIFGWSGKLCPKKRKKTAKEFYHELKELMTKYETNYGVRPRLRIITHSHGGNLALNLAKAKKNDADFVVHELIMLACPVQHITIDLLKNPCFERIYSIYSSMDILQVLDPQGIYTFTNELYKKYVKKTNNKDIPLFSKRKFPVQKNLIQVQVKVNKRGILHIEFLLDKFLRSLPWILNKIEKAYEGNEVKKYKKKRLFKITIH